MDDLYVLVWRSNDDEEADVLVSPLDENTDEDQGMLVYRSLTAAYAAARRQDELYGDDCICVPVKLTVFMANLANRSSR